jgi:hypothetical protein
MRMGGRAKLVRNEAFPLSCQRCPVCRQFAPDDMFAEKAQRLFEEMRKSGSGVEANTTTFNHVLDAASKSMC